MCNASVCKLLFMLCILLFVSFLFNHLIYLHAEDNNSTAASYSSSDEDKQSDDNSRRTITFAGRQWIVKNGTGMGPGPNNWSDSDQSVWVDTQGRLHLKIRNVSDTWYCAEVTSVMPTTYGMHRFYLDSRIDSLDKYVVAAPFLYKTDTQEIDIEFAKWGNSSNPAGNYTIQPSNLSSHHTFPVILNGGYSTHYFDWEPGSILFKSFHGHYAEPPNSSYLINSWTYSGSYNPPVTANLKIHINFWLYQGHVPSDGKESELIVSGIDYPVPQPQNLTITKTTSAYQLIWDASSVTTSFEVFGSSQPNSGFQLLLTTSTNQATISDNILTNHGIDPSMAFFHVKSVAMK